MSERYSFIEELRQELIDTGEASKEIMDYIDQRIKETVDDLIPQYIEELRDQVKS